MVVTVAPEPEDKNNFQFVLVDGQFIALSDLDYFLEKNYEKFKQNG